LQERIKEFVNADVAAALESLLEGVAVEHLGDRFSAGELDQVDQVHGPQPLAVPADLQMARIGQKDFADLGEIGLGVGVDLLSAEDRAGGVSAGGIADSGGVIADDQHRLVSKFLELPDDGQGNRMSEGDIGSGGIHAELDPQRFAGLGAAEQFAPQILFVENPLAAAR
jgi:hypothetical protein